MPSCLLDRADCYTCDRTLQRKDMSVFGNICDTCFKAHYRLCTTCGTLLRLASSRESIGAAVFYHNDPEHLTPLCWHCWIILDGVVRWPSTPFGLSFATYQRIRSKRKYGVEIETDLCQGWEMLHGHTIFGAKGDCTISGQEFDSPILYGDEGLAVIEKFLAQAHEKGWTTDENCGCHTHYDMRDETDQELYHIAYAYAKTYSFWSCCVSEDRREQNYCHRPQYVASSLRRRAGENEASFNACCQNYDRYDYVNIGAYRIHKTFEVRLLEGTVDAETICNWITIHARFMDYVKGLSFDDLDCLLNGDVQHVLSALVEIMDDVDLVDWLVKRIEEFSPSLFS